jgi:hypothetical protein
MRAHRLGDPDLLLPAAPAEELGVKALVEARAGNLSRSQEIA